jgi:ABC-2 type transport system ATP-binding protein
LTLSPGGRIIHHMMNSSRHPHAGKHVSGGEQSGHPVGPAVVVDDLHVVRGKREVLHGITVDVPQGQVVGLLGPSGCGKTTLMRAIVGVQIVKSGRVTVLGRPAGSKQLRRRVGYVTQDASVYDDLTIRQNLQYFRTLVGAPKSDIDRVLEATRLTDEASSLVANLSGGQVSRVSLAAALLGSPEVLVLDEPTVGLDPLLRVELWTLFRELAAQGTALLVSSHVMDEAVRCDRLMLMRDGLVLADDTPEALYQETGTTDMEQVFLTLIERETQSEFGRAS